MGVLLVALTLATLSADAQSSPTSGTQCPALTLDNPNPGDTLMPGGYVVSGIAFDPSVTDSSGISHVDFFLGARDAGGLYLGSTVPLIAPSGPPRFQMQLTIPSLNSNATDFVAYAYSAISPGQTNLAVPVRLGNNAAPVATPNVPPATPLARLSSTCQSVATAVALSPPGPAEVAMTPTPGPQLAGPVPAISPGPVVDMGGPIFDLSNPSPGDVLPLGGYVVSGTAYDPASAQGPGVDRVQFFLDPRETGGLLLGTASPRAANPGDAPTFSTELTIPISVPKGGIHMFTAYAHSSVTGNEAIVSVPVFAGARPTPTPLP
jgi:hypothetical protein